MSSQPHRRRTRPVRLAGLPLGGGAAVVVQSMTNTKTHDAAATLRQIRKLAQAGCELVRVAVPDQAAAEALPGLVKRSPVPLVADIHFDSRLALAAIRSGVAKIRINPGNMGLDRSLEVARAAARAGTAVRIGVNAGSLPEASRAQAKTPQALGRAMGRLALRYAAAFEKQGLTAIVLSVKASEVAASLTAYRFLAEAAEYPLHLGITEAGGVLAGAVKTAAGLSPLLFEGIGDTLRVSLTADPVEEIAVADMLLRATGVRRRGVEIISCPTCGRTTADLFRILSRVERALAREPRPIVVAVMGCVVNGPGEARHADVGIAGAPDGGFMLFRRGKLLRRVTQAAAVPALLEAIRNLPGPTGGL